MIIFCDGGSRGNPGPAASAFVITEKEKVLYKESKYLGIETNNTAEYTAVLIAINCLIDNLIKDEVIFNLDSQLVERQLNGIYKVKNENLKTIFNEIKFKILENKLKVMFKWNYRTSNKLADEMVNKELDKH